MKLAKGISTDISVTFGLPQRTAARARNRDYAEQVDEHPVDDSRNSPGAVEVALLPKPPIADADGGEYIAIKGVQRAILRRE